MTNIDFFKQQAKNFLKDYNSRVFNENEGFYDYNPRFFNDIDDIIINFDINEEESFTLMNAQHIIAKLSGFYKWNELIKASESALELGKLLLVNREEYQNKQGFFTNMVESLIVEDWKDYEAENLKGLDDETKLEVFKTVFLSYNKSKRVKNPKAVIDFSDDMKAQDMIVKIMREKGLTPEKAILSSITQKNCVNILATEWASIAVSLWGHADPDVKFEELDNPIIEFKLSKDKERLIGIVMGKEQISFKDAILEFVIFTLESLGYHI